MLYYLLFALVIVPFNLTNEFMFYNVLDCYKDVKIVGYLQKKNEEFKARKIFWKTADYESINESLDESVKHLDLLGYSPQYYFLTTLYVSGMTLVTLGI